MQPFERLRAIARHGDDDRVLVAEAADCLADFDDDPAALVVTCRRLLHHHPDCAPLWWVCSRACSRRPSPSEAAWEAEARVRGDATAARLAALLPFPADHPIAVLGWPELSGDALAIRPDLEVLAVRGPQRPADGSWERRLARSDAVARPGRPHRGRGARAVARAGRGRGCGPRPGARARRHRCGARRRSPGRSLVSGWWPGVGRVLPGPSVRRDAASSWTASPRTAASSCSTCRSPTASPDPPVSCVRSTSLRRVDSPVAPELLRLS